MTFVSIVLLIPLSQGLVNIYDDAKSWLLFLFHIKMLNSLDGGKMLL